MNADSIEWVVLVAALLAAMGGARVVGLRREEREGDPNEAASDDHPALFAAVLSWRGDDRIVRLLSDPRCPKSGL